MKGLTRWARPGTTFQAHRMAHAQIQRAKAMTCPGDASGLRWLQQRCRREKRGKADEACRGQVAEDGHVLQPHRAVALGVPSLSE